MDLNQMKAVAIAAAYQGGRFLQYRLDQNRQIQYKGEVDLVTEADLGSEKRIIGTIRERFPDHAILSEEAGMIAGKSDYLWIIDPLDGTTNFAHGLTLCCISIALMKGGRPVVGIVWNPFTGELFSAVKNQGAFLNGRRLNVSKTARLKESLLVTGFAYDVEAILAPIMERLRRCIVASQGVRRLGSAALDLCYVAAGRFEAFWEEQLNPWDTAAGYLVVQEAGGCVTDFGNRQFEPEMKSILASNGSIHAEMIELLDLKGTE
jgi:myo-inositol-1(or 4)-monophosphatase